MPFGTLFAPRVAQGSFVGTAEHQQRAEDLFKNDNHEEAIQELSLALKGPRSKDDEAELLRSRGQAFTSLSERLRSTPAAYSESNAVSGLDPTQLAQLALRDATRALKLQPKHPDLHLLQGKACMLLEQYAAAENAFLEGLSSDPSHSALQDGLRKAGAAAAGSSDHTHSPQSNRRRGVAHVDEVECTLCLKLLYEPVTVSCGHTFCRPCFLRAQDHCSRCPMCRTVLHVGRDLPVSITLKNILEKSFPQEYAERCAEEAADAGSAANAAEAAVPLFVMSCLMPGEKIALNVFEPRYRLMVRRCMEGNRRFGMAVVSNRQQLEKVACLAEILECQPLPDGRFYLEIVGRQRFRIESAWEQDGYRMAQPEFFTDTASSSSEEKQTINDLALHVETLADQWLDRFRAMAQAGSRDRFIQHMLSAGSAKPIFTAGSSLGLELPEAVSFWVAGMLLLDQSKRLRMLEMTSSNERLQFVQGLLQSHSNSGCSIQ